MQLRGEPLMVVPGTLPNAADESCNGGTSCTVECIKPSGAKLDVPPVGFNRARRPSTISAMSIGDPAGTVFTAGGRLEVPPVGFNRQRRPSTVSSNMDPAFAESRPITRTWKNPCHWTTKARVSLSQSRWYNSSTASTFRAALHGRAFAAIMMAALILALYMPNVWIVSGISSNEAIDIVLVLVMFTFILEFVALSSVDAKYFMSFFFLMDLVGTASMMLDISFMFGDDATRASLSSDEDTQKNLMLLRASRAAKVGARAGRLSRVLKILRFLPLLTRKSPQNKAVSVATKSLKSAELTNLLATRIACLTILLIMVVPLFDMWTFPLRDHSLQTWAERLALSFSQNRSVDFQTELQMMVGFFNSYAYGPYTACEGYLSGSMFECTRAINGWTPRLSAPPRMASALLVYTNTLMIGFNMHEPMQIMAIVDMVNITFIIALMVFSGLALSSTVTHLAVAPLERMLNTVKQIAMTVFKFSASVNKDDVDEKEDIDSSSEMRLLEKVVQRLAKIAELNARQNMQATEDMREEDIGILNMMRGKNIIEEDSKHRFTRALVRSRGMKIVEAATSLDDFGV